MLLSVCCKAQIALFIVESEFICFLELFISDGIREVIRKSMLVKKKKANFTYYNLTVWDYIFSLRNKCSNVWKKNTKTTKHHPQKEFFLANVVLKSRTYPDGFSSSQWSQVQVGRARTGRWHREGFLSCVPCAVGDRAGAAWRDATLGCFFVCRFGFFCLEFF